MSFSHNNQSLIEDEIPSISTKEEVQFTAVTTPLHDAAMNGNFEEVKKLKEKNPEEFLKMLMTRDHNDDLPLDRAAPRGHYEIVKLLVEEHKNYDLLYEVNKRNYNPLLSAIRWYCKVLDGTYNQFKCVGVFNTGKSRDSDYLYIIRLLMNEYPEYIHKPDNKKLYGFHYICYHVRDAIKNKNTKTLNLLKELISVLFENGMTLDNCTDNQSSPRSFAKQKGITVLADIEQTYKQTNNKESEKFISFQKPIEKKQITTKKTSKLTQPVQKSQLSFGLFDYEYETVITSPKDIEWKNENNSQSDKSSSNQEIYKKKPMHGFKKRSIKQAESSKPNKPKIVQKSVIVNLTHDECKSLTKDILNTLNLSGIKENHYNGSYNEVLAMLQGDDNNVLAKKFRQDRTNLVSELSAALKVESITTGFLCCRQTMSWIEIDKSLIQKIIKGEGVKYHH